MIPTIRHSGRRRPGPPAGYSRITVDVHSELLSLAKEVAEVKQKELDGGAATITSTVRLALKRLATTPPEAKP